MTDPTYALIIAFVLVALVTAVVIPAPAHAPDNEEQIQLSLQGAACALIILMGAFALSGHHAESTISGAVAWLLVMPCIWLSRAPGSMWYSYDEEDEDDDGGGSPTPRRPSDPPAPDDLLPGLRPPAVPGGRPTWAANAVQPAPLVATAARVRLLLAAQEAERLHADGEVQRLLAAAAALPQPEPQPAPVAAAVPEPASAPAAPLHWPIDPHDLRPAPRERADHRTIVHLIAAVAHAQGRRRRAAAKAARKQAERRAAAGARY